MQVGDTVRNKLTGKVYRLREIKRTVAIVQRGSTAISLRLENIELVQRKAQPKPTRYDTTMDNALELRAWADNDSDDERATMMRLAAAEIVRLREQYQRSQRYWTEAADVAIQKGDFRPLQLRIDMARSGPVKFAETDTTT